MSGSNKGRDDKNNNNSASYAAVAQSTPDNQPEGTVVHQPESQPPPYTPSPALSAGPSGAPGGSSSQGTHPSTQAPSKTTPHGKVQPQSQSQANVPRPQQVYGVRWAPSGGPTPGQTEAGVVVLVGESPEYYYALSRARRRFWGALFWAFMIYLVAGALVGGSIEDSRVHRHRSHKHKDMLVNVTGL